ncbi:amidase, partial [Mesorhizobium sp. M4B.F.Ca.ET.150.01.1.1]
DAKEPATVKVHVNGEPVLMRAKGCRHTGRVVVPASTHQGFHSVWRGAYGSIVTATVRSADGRTAGAYVVTGGIG